MITIKQAAEHLGLKNASSLSVKDSIYRKYLYGIGTRNIRFDIVSYENDIGREEELIERTKQFIEYLVHIENEPYIRIAKNTGLRHQSLWTHSFGYKNAVKILNWYKNYRPYSIQRFDYYYGWKIVNLKCNIRFK